MLEYLQTSMAICRGERTKFYLAWRHGVKVSQSCPTLCDLMAYTVHEILQTIILEWVASRSLLQGIFPTQGLNPGLPYCRQTLYQLSHKESPPHKTSMAQAFLQPRRSPGPSAHTLQTRSRIHGCKHTLKLPASCMPRVQLCHLSPGLFKTIA